VDTDLLAERSANDVEAVAARVAEIVTQGFSLYLMGANSCAVAAIAMILACRKNVRACLTQLRSWQKHETPGIASCSVMRPN